MTLQTSNNGKFVNRVLIVCGIVTLIVLSLWFVINVFDVVLLAFGAVLLAVFLHGLAANLRPYTRLSESNSVLVVSALLILVLGLAVWLLAPSVSEQVKNLRQDLPDSIRKASEYISNFGWGRTLLEQLPSSDELFTNAADYSLWTKVGSYFSTTLGALANIALMLLLAIYLAIEPKLYVNGLTKLFPIAYRGKVREILGEIGETLSWWLVGKGASMLFIGVLTWIGLLILGVPLSLTLGLIAGLFSFVPNFGPILSAVPAILLAFVDSPRTALYVAILFVVVQLIESNLVTPMIERRTVELPPVLTIVAQLALATIFGAVGLILATPILTVVMVLIQTVYIQNILGDKDTEVNEKEREEKSGQTTETMETAK